MNELRGDCRVNLRHKEVRKHVTKHRHQDLLPCS